ncbi:MAG: aminoacyl-tRNA hydrolase, partial [Dehalococcoidia bacterium]
GVRWTGKKTSVVGGGGAVPLAEGRMEVLLAKPRTVMNRSGEAAEYLVSRWRVDARGLLVVYDDMDLPLGTIRVRPMGSSAGHKGMQSIIDALGTQEVPRIRVGIGRGEGQEADAVDYLLSDFTDEEEQTLEGVVATVSDAILCILAEGLEAAMNRFN